MPLTASARALALASLVLVSCGDGDEDAPPPRGGTPGANQRFRNYLRPAPFPRLVVEIDSVPGAEPYAASQADIAAVLGTILHKPGGIVMQRDGAPIASRGAGHAWTFQELEALAADTFDLAVPADTTKMHVMFVDGHSADDTSSGRILGLAWAHTHIVMFKDTIESTCGSHPSLRQRERLCAGAERSIWVHELGHVLGLVDNGLPMVSNHRDPDTSHGRHDANENCVMYWSYDGGEVVNKLARKLLEGGEAEIGFDEQCLADLRAVRDAP